MVERVWRPLKATAARWVANMSKGCGENERVERVKWRREREKEEDDVERRVS